MCKHAHTQTHKHDIPHVVLQSVVHTREHAYLVQVDS